MTDQCLSEATRDPGSELQQSLIDPRLKPGAVDGVFGAEEEDALVASLSRDMDAPAS